MTSKAGWVSARAKYSAAAVAAVLCFLPSSDRLFAATGGIDVRSTVMWEDDSNLFGVTRSYFVKFTSHDDRTFTITRILLNKKVGVGGCDTDWVDPNLPASERQPYRQTLSFADETQWGNCGNPLKIEIWVNYGKNREHLSWNDD